VAVLDPLDARLLALVAEVGRVAVHDLARHAGMDVREVAARLAALGASGLPLVVGVECDAAALRYVLARSYGPPPAPAQAQPRGLDPVATWGPPGSAAWARGDELLTATVRTTPATRTGAVGDTLHTEGLDGERLAIRLVEVVDPADFLFTAAGYRLRPGERSVVVHTELINRGSTPLSTLPDQYLVLLAQGGHAVSKAPVALSSRPPHRVGVRPGDTAGGHTVYVLPETTELAAVRWSARPDDEQRALTWTVRSP
jgi:hypothetical protein